MPAHFSNFTVIVIAAAAAVVLVLLTVFFKGPKDAPAAQDQPAGPESAHEAEKTDEAEPQTGPADGPEDDGFSRLGEFQALEAKQILLRFEAKGIRFELDAGDEPSSPDSGPRHVGHVEIYYHRDDLEKVNAVMAEIARV